MVCSFFEAFSQQNHVKTITVKYTVRILGDTVRILGDTVRILGDTVRIFG